MQTFGANLGTSQPKRMFSRHYWLVPGLKLKFCYEILVRFIKSKLMYNNNLTREWEKTGYVFPFWILKWLHHAKFIWILCVKYSKLNYFFVQILHQGSDLMGHWLQWVIVIIVGKSINATFLRLHQGKHP